jgi:hypothetical protein
MGPRQTRRCRTILNCTGLSKNLNPAEAMKLIVLRR